MSFIKKNIKAIKLLLFISATAAAVAALVYVKYFYKPGHGPECFTYRFFGIYCMGCGNTRQLYYALNGQIKKAFSYNVACVIIYPAYIYIYYLLIRWTFGGRRPGYRQAYVLAAIAVSLVLYMILRNIPLKVFEVLRPPG